MPQQERCYITTDDAGVWENIFTSLGKTEDHVMELGSLKFLEVTQDEVKKLVESRGSKRLSFSVFLRPTEGRQMIPVRGIRRWALGLTRDPQVDLMYRAIKRLEDARHTTH